MPSSDSNVKGVKIGYNELLTSNGRNITMLLWLGFLACTMLIVYSGMRLSKYGDIIAEKTGLGRAWIGVVLMASVTSLPELVTGISSVTYAGVPDIAVGDVLGSCVFNMLILAILDAVHRAMPISRKAHQGHVLSAAFGLLLLSIVCVSMLLRENIPPIGWVGSYSFLCMVIYLTAMRLIFSYEKRKITEFLKEMAKELKYRDTSTKAAVLRYGINALIVIIAAIFLPRIREGIAVSTGLGQAFVCNIFIVSLLHCRRWLSPSLL
jgi:cation:H+ antiporter